MKERNIRIIFFIIIIILLLFSIYYIIKNKKELAGEINLEKTNVIAYNDIVMGITDFDTINPILSNNRDIQYISKLVYEPLINITEEFKLEKGLATEWGKIDEKTYLLRLNENTYWQNGEKFTAEDVEYTINYIKQNKSIYNENIKNINSLEIINDNTIKIYLGEPEESFEYMLCFPIICKNENIGTGEFYLNNIAKEEIVLQSKNRKFTIKIYDDVANLYNAFAKEEIDIITTDNINYEKYIGTIGYDKKVICGRKFDYLKFNLENKILSNPEVVQAISYAINRDEIIYNIYNNLYSIAEFPLQYGSYLYNDNIKYQYEPNKAKQILKEGGWNVNGRYWTKNGQKLILEITTNKDRKEVADIIKKNLEEIGIPVKIREISNSYYKNNLKNIKFNILLTGNIVSIKPVIKEYLDFNIENLDTIQETYDGIYKTYNENKNFMGLYFNSIILLYSNKLKGNFECNWYNIFYNINTWYKIKD